jgi:hypothetical protein
MQAIHRLMSQNADIPFTDTALVFCHMVRLAQPVMQAYQGDLYHDALWLHAHASSIPAEQVFTFYWVLDGMHTLIGLDRNDLSLSGAMYRMTVCQEPDRPGCWKLVVTTVDRSAPVRSRARNADVRIA